MKAVTWSLFYAVIGALFLCAGTFQGVGFYLLAGGGFLLLGAGEAWVSVRSRGKREPSGWRFSHSMAFLLIAACYVYRGAADPTGTNVGMAAVWGLLGAAYIAKAALCRARAKAEKTRMEAIPPADDSGTPDAAGASIYEEEEP